MYHRIAVSLSFIALFSSCEQPPRSFDEMSPLLTTPTQLNFESLEEGETEAELTLYSH